MLVGRVEVGTGTTEDNSCTTVVKFIENRHVQVSEGLEEILGLDLDRILLAVVFDLVGIRL